MEWMLMPLKRYADFSGRSRRMEFWMWQVFKFIVGMVISILFFVMFGAALASYGANKDPAALAAMGGGFMIMWLICMVFGLGILIPDIAVAVRRLHDTNRSGWWILAPLGPYVIAIICMGVAGASAGMAAQSGGDVGASMGIAVIIGMICMLAAAGLALTLLVFYFLEGTPGPNRFGPDPKGREAGVFN
jgi:uncharacterized membrane protein YhaH (DUF805 family)